MPGITGIICQRPVDGVEEDLAGMIAAMRHEPDYRAGQYINPELGLYVGWMCPPSPSGGYAPVISNDKDVVLIFHGETYLTNGDSCVSRSAHSTGEPEDSSYLLRQYEENGDEFVRHLNGWFCGLLADLRERRIILFNDRYGMSRLYTYEGEDITLFGSEAKSLLKVNPELRVIDPEALAQLLRYDCVIENRSLFKDVALVPGGSVWSFDNQRSVRKKRYFDFGEWEQQDALQPNDFYDKFASAMTRIAAAYAGDINKVALSLTAGLDTRAVMAGLHLHDHSFPCYTFGGVWGETYDIAIARRLAAVYNQPYQTIKINGDFFKDFAALAEKSVYISDGNHNAFGAHDLYFNRIARQIAPVRLTGKYGSEVVRGRKLIPFGVFPEDAVVSDLRPFLQQVQAPQQVSRLSHPLSRTVREDIPWYMSGRLTLEQSQLTVRTPYMDNVLVRLLFQVPRMTTGATELQARYIDEYAPALSRLATDTGKLGTSGSVVRWILPRLHGILFRSEYLYLTATPHWLTRVDRSFGYWHPERLFSGRHKYEWYRIWAATHLADFIRAALLNPHADYTRYFDYRSISKMVKRHTAGTHNYLNEISKALTIELVCSSLLRC